MADQAQNFGQGQENYLNDINVRIRDLEERQRMLKDRLLLIGQNLIDLRESHNEEMTEIRKSIDVMKSSMSRLISFLEAYSGEMNNFVKKDDFEILAKQAKMFQPLNLTFHNPGKDLKK